MTDSGEYEEVLFKLSDEINDVVRSFCKPAYVFLKWTPCRFETYTSESAFAREVINYYVLICECGKYLWANKDFQQYLKQCWGFSLSNYQNYFFDCLRRMRIFFAHRFDSDNSYYFDAVCNFLGLKASDYLDEIEDNRYITIRLSESDWEIKRKELFKKVKDFLTSYRQILHKIANGSESERNTYIEQWKDAIVDWYKIGEFNYFINVLCPDEKIAKKNILKKRILSDDSFEKALNKTDLTSYEPIEVYDFILDEVYGIFDTL